MPIDLNQRDRFTRGMAYFIADRSDGVFAAINSLALGPDWPAIGCQDDDRYILMPENSVRQTELSVCLCQRKYMHWLASSCTCDACCKKTEAVRDVHHRAIMLKTDREK